MAGEGATLTYKGELTVTSCWCGIALAVPASLYTEARDQGKQIYCPLGHAFVFSKPTVEKLREQLQAVQEDRARYQQRHAAERDLRVHTEKRLAAQRGATTRARKRHAAGVCPCCGRTFQQVQRHMASQHPDYDPAKGA